VFETLISHLTASKHLTDEQVRHAVELLVDEIVAASIKADFLSALADKGETIEEIAAFASALRDKSIQPPLDPAWRNSREILDVVGTGGDRAGTFNISTTVAILCAAAGVAVAKHGNRAITSQVGSADVLEALGIRVDLSPAEAAQSLREHNFAFFFAPNYHPAFKHIAPARKLCAERGQRTIFNYLGPLLNPARPSSQLVGVPRPELCEPIARVLQSLGVRRGMVLCGSVGQASRLSPSNAGKSSETGATPVLRETDVWLDELSTLGETTIAEFYQDRGFSVSTMSPENITLQHATLADLKGGDRNANAEIVRRILGGEERGPKRDAVLLNAAAALLVAGHARSFSEGWDVAAAAIEDGRAQAKLLELSGTR
jgi:anthranilate phosphoribosyltransferase